MSKRVLVLTICGLLLLGDVYCIWKFLQVSTALSSLRIALLLAAQILIALFVLSVAGKMPRGDGKA